MKENLLDILTREKSVLVIFGKDNFEKVCNQLWRRVSKEEQKLFNYKGFLDTKVNNTTLIYWDGTEKSFYNYLTNDK